MRDKAIELGFLQETDTELVVTSKGLDRISLEMNYLFSFEKLLNREVKDNQETYDDFVSQLSTESLISIMLESLKPRLDRNLGKICEDLIKEIK